MINKAEAIDVDWYLKEKNCPCDLMMRCASADFTDGTARTSCILIWAQLYTFLYVSYIGMATDSGNNEDYAKIWTRPHLDTLYFAHDAYRVSPSQF